MLPEYSEAAMRQAHFETLREDGTYYGEIPVCQGVYANAPTLDECRNKLRRVLEDWILFRVHMHLELPKIDGLELTVKKAMRRESVPTPPILYEYYAFNEWTQGIFARNEIYFQSPDGFNDPFDSKVSTTYEGTVAQRVSRLIDLWRQGPPAGKKEEDLRPQAMEIVNRGQDIPLIPRTLQLSDERRRKQMGRGLLRKANDWEYEDEWRIVPHPHSPGNHSQSRSRPGRARISA
jgi:predicted RNase H-like HicB family nuclease